MKKQKIKILKFNKEKIAKLADINTLYGGSGNCGGDPGGSDTKNKSEDVKKCPKAPNSGLPITCNEACIPDNTQENC